MTFFRKKILTLILITLLMVISPPKAEAWFWMAVVVVAWVLTMDTPLNEGEDAIINKLKYNEEVRRYKQTQQENINKLRSLGETELACQAEANLRRHCNEFQSK